MRVFIGHVLFPPSPSPGSGAAKRFKSENGMRAAETAAAAISASAVAAALNSAAAAAEAEAEEKGKAKTKTEEKGKTEGKAEAKGKAEAEAHVRPGRGASFCFAPGLLAPALRAPAHEPLRLPEGSDFSAIERANRIPRFGELRVSDECSLQVYWEERVVVYPSSFGGSGKNDQGCSGNGNDNITDDKEKLLLTKRLLVVGAGGIGCELLKVLVQYGFKSIDIFDLDTIDATNLNRQFLFRIEDVGSSKSEMARRTILEWFKNATPEQRPDIRAHHANIKDPIYDDAFFSQFALVLNALDNVSARQHVNRMCMRSTIPLIESGTMGYNGQVQPIVKGLCECYDCQPKASTKPSVAVCTIHARPTTMLHCVHYAKELYQRLFGDSAVDDSESLTGKGEELAFVDGIMTGQKVNQGNGNGTCNVSVSLARCLFRDKIEELLSMKTAWPTQPPVPLEDSLLVKATLPKNDFCSKVEPELNRDSVPTLEDALTLFIQSAERCRNRGFRVAFLKEDNDIVDFVSATANLRATVFHIPRQSVEDIRSIAGSIVPAIATTNAIVAAAVVHQAVALLHLQETPKSNNDSADLSECQYDPPQMVYVRKVPQVRRRRGKGGLNCGTDLFIVHSAPPNPPNRNCAVCRQSLPLVRVRLDTSRVTVGMFVRVVLGNHLGMTAPSIFRDANVIYEKDEYEALLETPLQGLMEGLRVLELIVDDMDHDVEWRLIVSHQSCDFNSNDAATVSEEELVVAVEGIEEAVQLEREIIEERRKDNEREEEREQSIPVQMNGSTQGRANASEVINLDSESDDGAISVVELD